jgi:probable F420-dependent oxidoreductase
MVIVDQTWEAGMKIGVVYPQIELGGAPAAVLAFAKAAEALGYDHLAAYDHVLGAVHEARIPPLTGPYTDQHPFHDPFVMFAYLAGLTPRLEFVPAVLVLPQRQTSLVARQAADLDLFAGGRTRLGVGTGWNYVEYQALGEDFGTRGPRLDEQIEVLRRLWTEPSVSFEGRFHRLDRVTLNPRPTRSIPIWMGGRTDVAYRRAARSGDGFIFAGHGETAENGWARISGYLAQAGRNPAEFGRDLIVWAQTSPSAMRDIILRWRDLGGTHASVATMNCGLATLDEHIGYIAEIKRLLDG